MFIKKLILKDFRNYSESEIDFSARLIFLTGNNGQGKTNILEAVQMFSILKSFRENSDEELIRWSADTFYAACLLNSENREKKLEIGYSKKKKKKFKINSEEIHRKTEFIGEFLTVLFSPSDLKIIEGGPADRRKFLDSVLCASDRNYLQNLLEYNKLLKQKNAALKSGSRNFRELNIWDKMLSQRIITVANIRNEALQKIRISFQEAVRRISGNKDIFDIQYIPNIPLDQSPEEILMRKREVDLRVGHSTAGIHRDEIFIGKDGMDLLAFASQGQKRTAVLSLKGSQIQFLKDRSGEDPILLIDDVIRELDASRREYFIDLILSSGQTIFTSTDLEGIEDYIKKLGERTQIFHIENGTVKSV